MSGSSEQKVYTEEDLTCPLTKFLFLHPVTLTCGDQKHTFEEEALIRQAQTGMNDGCPTCRAPFVAYRENAKVKQAAEAYMAQKPGTIRYAIGDMKPPRPVQKVQKQISSQKEGEVWYDLRVYEAERKEQRGREQLQELAQMFGYQLEDQRAADLRNRINRWVLGIVLFWILSLLAGISFGIYLAVLITPIIAGALLSLGIVPVFAWMLGALGGVSLIFASFTLLTPGGWLSQIVLNGLTKKGVSAVVYFLAFLAAIGFGIYLCTLVGPMVYGALVAAGISSAIAGFIVAAGGLLFIRSTLDWLELIALFIGLPAVLIDSGTVLQFVWGKDRGLAIAYGLGWLAGLGLGIYLCILVTPYITSALLVGAVSSGVGSCITMIVSLALTTALVRIMPIVLSFPVYLGKYISLPVTHNREARSELGKAMSAIVWAKRPAEPEPRIVDQAAEDEAMPLMFEGGERGPAVQPQELLQHHHSMQFQPASFPSGAAELGDEYRLEGSRGAVTEPNR